MERISETLPPAFRALLPPLPAIASPRFGRGGGRGGGGGSGEDEQGTGGGNEDEDEDESGNPAWMEQVRT